MGILYIPIFLLILFRNIYEIITTFLHILFSPSILWSITQRPYWRFYVWLCKALVNDIAILQKTDISQRCRFKIYLLLKNPAYSNDCTIIGWRCIFDSCRRIACVNNRITSYVYSYMPIITDNITRLHTVIAYPITNAAQCTGWMRQRYTKMRIYTHYKSRTVCSICQAWAAVYIRIA